MAYFEGFGLPLNRTASLTWIERAANQNHSEAQFRLGTWYLEGTGVDKDVVSACMWLLMAASNGHEPAWEHLEQLEKSLTKRQLKRAQRMAVRWVEEYYEPRMITARDE